MGKKARNVRSRKAVSPVIATVILVAIAITVSVAVAFWMGSIAGQFTEFEQVEIQSASCTKLDDGLPAPGPNYYWKIEVKLKNTGTAPATLIGVFVNDIEVTEYGVTAYAWADHKDETVTSMGTGAAIPDYTLLSGASSVTGDIVIYIDDGYLALTSGTTVNIKIHSAGGMDYIKLIGLV